MNRMALANELIRMAKELTGYEHPSEEDLKDYLEKHPKADKSKHWVKGKGPSKPVKDWDAKDIKEFTEGMPTPKGEKDDRDFPKADKEEKDEGKKDEATPAKDLEKNSDDYHMHHVVPRLKKMLRQSMPEGCQLRGPGSKIRKHIEAIADVDIGNERGTYPVIVNIHGSYMTDSDGEYEVRLHSPYITGDHTYHAKFTGDPEKDAQTISKDVGEMMDDFKGFIKEQYGKKEEKKDVKEVPDKDEKAPETKPEDKKDKPQTTGDKLKSESDDHGIHRSWYKMIDESDNVDAISKSLEEKHHNMTREQRDILQDYIKKKKDKAEKKDK